MRGLVSKEMGGICKDGNEVIFWPLNTQTCTCVCTCTYTCTYNVLIKNAEKQAGKKANAHLADANIQLWGLKLLYLHPCKYPLFTHKETDLAVAMPFSWGLTTSKLMMLSLHPCFSVDLSITSCLFLIAKMCGPYGNQLLCKIWSKILTPSSLCSQGHGNWKEITFQVINSLAHYTSTFSW